MLDQGDLIVPIPKLRLKGVNPSEKSKEWAEKFNKDKFISDLVPQGVFLQFFFNKSVLFDLVISDVLKRKQTMDIYLWESERKLL